jgi:coproporphyrinogen III oxidase
MLPSNKEQIADVFKSLQQEIVDALTVIDGGLVFQSDDWSRYLGGGGCTKTTSEGRFIEKGGVAFSAVSGIVTEAMAKQLKIDAKEFFATGVSIVLHSVHPQHPTIHMNVRYFETDQEECWFGGGIDLTPMYVDKAYAKSFHLDLKKLCDSYRSEWYTLFKNWADDYFYLEHREETRGVGGIFFDHLTPIDAVEKSNFLSFCLALGRLFPALYGYQLSKGVGEATLQEQKWQAIRRGRYVEYNLLFDRGTKFGIASNGRTESILLSMPPVAQWEYMHNPEVGTEEWNTLQLLRKGIDWIS